MTKLNTDLNVTPYFDDFDEEKDFYRVLYRPGVPVQARELTQSQTILQQQISRFGSHVFKEGSVVDGCHVTYRQNMRYVSVKNNFKNDNVLSVEDITDSHLLVGNTSGVRAVVLTSKTGFEAAFPHSNRFYIRYIRTGDTDEKTFIRNEYIKVYSPSQSKHGNLNAGNFVDEIQVIDQVNALGRGYGVSIGDGTIYHKGFFQRVESSTVVVKDFDTDPTNYRVGFDSEETIITEDQDESLNDNALGYTNENAPGAHRLKLKPFLVAKLKDDDSINKNFFAIVEFDGPAATEQNNVTDYNKLGDEFAQRTFEKSGNFVVKPFTLETMPGVNANTKQVDANLFSYSISSGTAYIRGYRIEKLATSNVVAPRAATTKLSEAQVVAANYGNYIIVNELMGTFDWKSMAEVTLYDVAQATISDKEKASGARAGSIIGKANIRGLDFEGGTKGIASGKYVMYLDNIRMNSGKSFSKDVKSVYSTSGAYGAARADVVLSTNFYSNGTSFTYANLQDSNRNTLIFPIGVNAVKTLADNSGATDTQFIFRDVANATLGVNGFISVAMNPAAPGGPEKINAFGTLTTAGKKNEFDLVLTTDVLTINLTGTAAITSGQSNVIGTGTSFNTIYKVGDFIRINHQSGADDRRITAVTNATHITTSATLSVTNASATFAKLYLEGTHLDLSTAGSSINVSSNTTFTVSVDIPANLTTASNTMVTFPVLKSDTYPIKKVANKDIYVKINCGTNVKGSMGPWILGIPDVYKIQSVHVGSNYSTSNPDQSTWFSLDSGQRESFYDLARLYVKPQYASNISGSTQLLVKLSCFVPDASDGVGYFCADSYAQANVLVSEIPTFVTAASEKIELRDCIDFRPYKIATGSLATTVGAATINPIAANVSTYNSATYGKIAAADYNFQCDVTYYLPRRDLVVMNHVGDLSVITGQPGENPVTPQSDDDVMVIASTYVTPFPSLTTREGVDANKSHLKITHDIKTHRRYTERDIGAIDQRLKNVEYYTVLNAIEQKARDLTISDVNGFDRFKNGIFADPFNGHGLGRVDDFEYKIAIDGDRSVGRPFFKKSQVDYKYATALSTTQKVGNLVLSPFTNKIYASQNYASKTRNCTESVWSWQGKMKLYPAYDDSRDETRLPNVNVEIDLASAWEDFANSPFGTNFGDWRTANTSVTTTNLGAVTETATTVTRDRLINTLNVDTTSSKQDLGKFVKDISIESFMRSRIVSFIATNLKPNTVLHAFFDETPVDEHIAPGVETGISEVEAGREDKVLERIGNWGSQIKSDASGVVKGLFRIPEGTFRVGDRVLRISDTDLLDDEPTTSADARFSASNISVTTQGISINTIEPEISVDTRTQTAINTTRTTVVNPQTDRSTDGNSGWPDGDPIAQSFFIEAPEGTSGMFITKLDVYFKSKDPTLGVTAMICETRLGVPDTTKIIGTKHLDSSQVLVSDNATAVTTFVFTEPVFVTAGNSFAFLIKPDGDSPEYRIWLGETGGYDITTNVQIYQNPYIGVAFVSSNMNTWTELQKEDLKFTLYRAEFNVGSTSAYFNNEDDEVVKFSGLLRANSSTVIQVGDLAYTGNSTVTLTGANTTQPFGTVQSISEADGIVNIDSSTGGWASGQTIIFHRPSSVGNTSLITANSKIASATVDEIYDIPYHLIVPRFSTLTPARTKIDYAYSGKKVGSTQDSWISVTNDMDYEFRDTTREVLSFSNEGGDKSSKYLVTLSTDSKYVSPVIDLRRKSSFVIENLINDSIIGEANTRYGEATTKYISRIITLDDGQEAEDLLITVAAYRPVGTDIHVFVKFKNGEDGDQIDNLVWTEMIRGKGELSRSNPMNSTDFIDFDFNIPTSAPATNPKAAYLDSDGILTYANDDGSIFNSYKSYMIKIVLTSDNPARVPLINDVRSIALQV